MLLSYTLQKFYVMNVFVFYYKFGSSDFGVFSIVTLTPAPWLQIRLSLQVYLIPHPSLTLSRHRSKGHSRSILSTNTPAGAKDKFKKEESTSA